MRDAASDTGSTGEALGKAVLSAVRDLNFPKEVITDTYGDINGELARNHDWGFAVLRTVNRFPDGTDYVTSAGQCGDVGAATGALGCVLATEAWKFGAAQVACSCVGRLLVVCERQPQSNSRQSQPCPPSPSIRRRLRSLKESTVLLPRRSPTSARCRGRPRPSAPTPLPNIGQSGKSPNTSRQP